MDRTSMDSSHYTSRSDIVELELVCSRTDTDATADDLPGPGRTLDKVYTVAGRQIELFLSKSAERLGYGPRVTTQRIRQRRAVVIHASEHVEGQYCRRCYVDTCAKRDAKKFTRKPASIKNKTEKIEKDIQSLLKYVNSKVPSTQKQALDHILDLSVSSSYLRALLKSKGATQIISDSVQIYSKFRFSDFDDVLLSSSRKALVSLADAEINTLLQEWITVARSNARDKTIAKPLWSRIAPYLHDSETAFLVMRILRRTFQNFSPPTKDYVFSSVAKSPNYFEWEECDAAFCTTFGFAQGWLRLAKNVPGDWVLRNADRMPRVLKTLDFQSLSMDITEMDSVSFLKVHRLKFASKQCIISTWGNDKHTLSLNALKSTYTCPGIQPVLGALACPLERLVIDFVGSGGDFYESIPTSAEFRVYSEIVSYIDLVNDTLRIKAWNYINFFLSVDVYRCDMMLQALSSTKFGMTDDFSSFMKTKREQCIPKKRDHGTALYRHLNRNDNQIHLREPWDRCCSSDLRNEEEITYPHGSTLDMRVKRSTVFSSAGFYPLVAGYGIGGKCAYAAWFDFDTFRCIVCDIYVGSMLSTVTEGMKPEDLRIEVSCPHLKAQIIPESFEVRVLRYAPDAYPKVLDTSEEGVDATGPFSWKPTPEHGHEPIFSKCYAKVILAEGAIAGDEIPDEAEYTLGDGGWAVSELDELVFHSWDEESEIESISWSDEAELVSCEGDKAVSEREKSELASKSCDDIPRTDGDLPSRDGGTEAVSMSELDDLEGTTKSDSEINELEHHSSIEENRAESDELDFSSCKGEDETRTDPKALETGQLDSPLDPDVESIDIDPPSCGESTVTGLDGLAMDETGGQALASGARYTEGVAQFNMTVLVIVVVLSFILGFTFKAYI